MAMDPVIFIDPGVGRMWEPQGEGTEITHSDPNKTGVSKGKLTHEDFLRGTAKYNPTCGVSFYGKTACAAYCIDDGVLKALTNLTSGEPESGCQIKVKLTVGCSDKDGFNNFFAGFTETKTTGSPAPSNVYLGVRMLQNSKYTTHYPTNAEVTEDNKGTLGHVEHSSNTLHNISLMICREGKEFAFGAALDDNYVKLKLTATSMPETLHFGLYLPSNAFYISNVIVCYKDANNGGTSFDKEIIPPETHLAVLDLSEPDENEDTTFEKDKNYEENGEWVGKANGDKLVQTVNIYNLTKMLAQNDDSNLTVPDNPSDEEQTEFINGYSEAYEFGTVVLYGIPAYKSQYFSRQVKGSNNLTSADKKGFGEIPAEPDTDSTYCIDLQIHNKKLKDLHQKTVSWKITNS